MSIDQHVAVCRECGVASLSVDGVCEQCNGTAAGTRGRRHVVILAGGAFVGIAAAMVVAAVTDSPVAAAFVVGGSVLLAMTAALTAD